VQLKASLHGQDYATQVQMLAPGSERPLRDVSIHGAAETGLSGAGGTLPHQAQIQRSFGGYDISQVTAHTDSAASRGAAMMGADAYATGNHVVLGQGGQSLRTVAHETAHVVQQRAGVSLSGGVGQKGDAHERHADAVADLVVQGKSAEGLLGDVAGTGGSTMAVQRQETDESQVGKEICEVQEPEMAPAPLELSVARHNARDSLDALSQTMAKYVTGNGRWVVNNSLAFIDATGGAGAVRFDSVAASRTATNVLRSAMQAGGRHVGAAVSEGIARDEISSKIKSFASIAGTVTGVVVSTVWGLVDAQFEQARINSLVHAGSKVTAAAMRTAINGASAGVDREWQEWSTERQLLLDAIMTAPTLAALEQLKSIFAGHADAAGNCITALKEDRSLSNEMIQTWLMQTAKDGETGGKDVNPDHHEAARKGVERAKGPKDYDKSKLFVEQCRYEWKKLGLNPNAPVATLTAIFQKESTAEGRGELSVGDEAHAFLKKAVGLPVHLNTLRIPELASQTFRFYRVANGTSMMTYLAGIGEVPHPTTLSRATKDIDGDPSTEELVSHEPTAKSHVDRHRRILEAVMHGKVMIECQVKCAESDGAAYVEGFSYKAELRTLDGRGVNLSFETSP